jgi:trehalose-phosphatase
MKELSDTVSLDLFFDRVADAQQPALLLDYDGTLAPFRNDRDRAFPYDGVRDRLERILETTSTRLVLVSGRPAADVRRLVGLERSVEIWGTHGWEQLRRDGTYVGPELSPHLREILEEAGEVITGGLEVPERCERKPASIAFHVRNISEDRAERELAYVRDRWQALLEDEPLSIEPFDGGLELRVTGQDKGAAVQSILQDVSPTEPVAYLGDDLTDEDAFEALENRGLRVLVREEYRDTKADLWLIPPEELLIFLGRWKEAAAV